VPGIGIVAGAGLNPFEKLGPFGLVGLVKFGIDATKFELHFVIISDSAVS